MEVEIREEEIMAKLAEAAGDLSSLTKEELRVLYHSLCQQLGLDPELLPFYVIQTSDGKRRLYLNKGGAEALRKVHNITTNVLSSGFDPTGSFYQIVVEAVLPNGRKEQGIAVADLRGKKGVEAENAVLFAETKAKRRTTISLLGIGSILMDESEALSIPGGVVGRIAPSGEIDLEERIEKTPSPPAIQTPNQPSKTPLTRGTLEKLMALFESYGTGKAFNRALIEALLGRSIPSVKAISEEEGLFLLEVLGEVGDPSEESFWNKLGKRFPKVKEVRGMYDVPF